MNSRFRTLFLIVIAVALSLLAWFIGQPGAGHEPGTTAQDSLGKGSPTAVRPVPIAKAPTPLERTAFAGVPATSAIRIPPWQESLDAWKRRDIRQLAANARRQPEKGSFYFAGNAAFYCMGALSPDPRKGDRRTRIANESGSDPELMAKRLAALDTMLSQCEGRSYEQWKTLFEELAQEGPASGDARWAMERRWRDAWSLQNNPATDKERLSVLQEFILSNDPEALSSARSAFSLGSSIVGYPSTPEPGHYFDDSIFGAIALANCANHGVCGLGIHNEAGCAFFGQCWGMDLFGHLQASMPAAQWERTYAIYLALQGALATGRADALALVMGTYPPKPAPAKIAQR